MKNYLKLNWALLCMGTSIDQRSNNITLFGLVEELKVKKEIFAKFPVKKEGRSVVPVRLELATLWSREKTGKLHPFEVSISLISPKERVVNRMVHKAEIPTDKLRLRLIFGIGAMGLEEAGLYHFEIKARSRGEQSFKKFTEVPVIVYIE